MQKSVIFISNFHPFVSRNVFDSGTLKLIADSSDKVFIFVLKEKEEYFKEKYEGGNVHVVGVSLIDPINTRDEIISRRCAELLLNTHTKVLHQKIYRAKGGKLYRYWFARFTMMLTSLLPFLRRLARTFFVRAKGSEVFDTFFSEYTPELVFVTDPFSPYDTLLMKAARKHKTALRSLVRSWDNFTTKEYLQVVPDTIMVQNMEMIHEGVALHDLPEDRFRLVGVPQFEYYKRYIPVSREVFCARLGFDPSRSIILFSPAGDKFSFTDWQICELLKRAEAAGKFGKDVQFVVRLHPMNPADLSKFERNERFVIDDPRVSFKAESQKQAELDMSAVNHLADSLYHSDVVVNTVSSLIIDAAIFDTPIVTVGFDGWEKNVPFVKSVLAEQSNEWMQVLLAKGISPITKNIDELVNEINVYLSDPSRDKDKRERFVKEHCWKLDGKAHERIAECVLE